jgi:peptidoglycan/LPS O-acetylase OafA/YrhL
VVDALQLCVVSSTRFVSDKSPSLYIPSLDGIRAIAVMLVVVTHSGFEFASGALGVNVFFFLSGFLITTLLRREHDRAGQISFRRFYIRRALRIFPPMYLLLVVAVTLSATGVLHTVAPGVATAQFLHCTNYVHILGNQVAPGTEIMWSLSVEEHFYLVFPAAFSLLCLVRERPRAVLVIAFCVLVMLWRVYVVRNGFHGGASWAYEATDTRMDSILWGCALAMFANPYFEPNRAKVLNRPYLALFGITVVLASQAYRADWFTHTYRYTLQCLSFAPLFVCAMMRPTAFPFTVLNWRWVRWIGGVSYGLYLYHYLVIAVLTTHLHLSRPLTLIVTLGISLPLCALSEALIENPAARLRKRFG